jgi:ethanolamine utilization protein EutN
MRLADVIGTVTLARPHPTIRGFRFVLARPAGRESLHAAQTAEGEEIVIYDDLGAGPGLRIAFAESGEAAAPFYPEKKPIDAYCAALIDRINIME